MQSPITPINSNATKEEIDQASNAAMASLLNLTFLPVIAFVWLVVKNRGTNSNRIDGYHIKFGIKLNLSAAFFLLLVTAIMIITGGFYSAWTWVYVITYFTLVHSFFIVTAVWLLTRAWSGKRVWHHT
ncbi:MAG: hypothetical protein L3J28_10420 [Candidatus Polarisedimenticolaceae bacterium]|nr:hypothetical protein [Candidatus Polarisedimenticolaceae bacterium]